MNNISSLLRKEENMIDNMSLEDFKTLMFISSHLGSNYAFKMKTFGRGIQVNWAGPRGNIMWRNINWDTNTIELVYDVNKYVQRFDLERLKGVW